MKASRMIGRIPEALMAPGVGHQTSEAIDRSNLPDYVLAPYPRDVFTDEVLARVAEDLETWLKTGP